MTFVTFLFVCINLILTALTFTLIRRIVKDYSEGKTDDNALHK